MECLFPSGNSNQIKKVILIVTTATEQKKVCVHVCVFSPCLDHLQTLQCSVGPKQELSVGPESRSSQQLRCEGPFLRQGTRRHLKTRNQVT